MASWFLKNSFTYEKDRQVASILSTLIWASGSIYLILIVVGLITHDREIVTVALPGGALLTVPWLFLRRRKLNASSFAFSLFALCTVTAIATVGQGIRDTAVVAYPIIFIFAGLTLNRRLFRVCVILALIAIFWLALGEIYGWFVPGPFEGTTQTFILLLCACILFLVAALAMELLATNMRENLTRAEKELLQRKLAEETLRESEARFRQLADFTFEALLIHDKGILLDVNASFCDMFGYLRSEVIGKRIMELIAPASRDLVLENIRIEFDKPYENGILRKDGTVVAVETVGKPINFQGRMVRVTAMRDITERKKAEYEHQKYEQQLQQHQKLESLGVLAGGIAHDFNNLLGGIYGYIDLAGASANDEKLSRYLAKAMGTIERARSLTLQLLTFAKGGAPIKKIGSLFPFVQETTQFALSGSNISCNFNVPHDIPFCEFDKNQIGQVIDNIVINAKQAMPGGGTIELTASKIRIAKNEHPPLSNGDYIKLSIKDTGIGIPKEIAPRIFDPFFTTKTTGHGLGLATCYSIITRHGGCIDAESEPGYGCTFHVFLPAFNDIDSCSAEMAAALHMGSGIFLVMDDQNVMRETIGDMLNSLGYTVVCKENGQEAIDFVAAETKADRTIAGMIFDLTIPGGMGGLEAIGEIRKLNPQTPVFVTSGYAEDPVMAHPLEHGFTASICKPFRLSELSNFLNSYLSTINNK